MDYPTQILPADQYKNKVANLTDGYAVRYNGIVQAPRFNSYGAAATFLCGLESLTRKQEPETLPCWKEIR